jgi:hypothetical protein
MELSHTPGQHYQHQRLHATAQFNHTFHWMTATKKRRLHLAIEKQNQVTDCKLSSKKKTVLSKKNEK